MDYRNLNREAGMILNYTTEVPTEKSIAEIQRLLSGHGVTAIMTEYEGPQISALSFQMKVGTPKGEQLAGFKLPCNWRAVQQIFKVKNKNRKRIRGRLERVLDESDAQAQRVAWRIIKDWIEAQLALVEVNMVTVPQIFLPYMMMSDNRTLAEHVATDPKFLLGDGN
jgi:hypothetical protein